MKDIIWWVLAMASVVAGLYFLPRLLTMTLGTEPPTAVVISRSMWPVLNRGDMIFIKAASREEIKIGTIIVFRFGAGIAIHRVARIKGNTIITKGDANPEEDDPITYDDVVGRLPIIWGREAKIPLVGRIALMAGSQVSTTIEGQEPAGPPGFMEQMANYTKNPVGLFMMVAIPAGLFLMVAASEGYSQLAPGRKKRRWRQRKLERIRKRFPHAKHA